MDPGHLDHPPDVWADAERHHYVLAKDSSQRLDVYLHNRLKGMSRHQVQKLIALGARAVVFGVPVTGSPLAKPRAGAR